MAPASSRPAAPAGQSSCLECSQDAVAAVWSSPARSTATRRHRWKTGAGAGHQGVTFAGLASGSAAGNVYRSSRSTGRLSLQSGGPARLRDALGPEVEDAPAPLTEMHYQRHDLGAGADRPVATIRDLAVHVEQLDVRG